MSNFKKPTQVVHPEAVTLRDGNTPLISPVHHSVKYQFDDMATMHNAIKSGDGYFYSRAANPTVRELELSIARLQERPEALAVASGMAAVSTCLLSLLESGDHMILALELYKPTRVLTRRLLQRWGISHSIISMRDWQGLAECMARKETKLILFESPSNPMLHVADLTRMLDLSRQNGVTTVLDNTFAGLHNHGNFEIDYFVHSLTKYASGHGDVMGGAVIGKESGIGAMRMTATYMGPVLDPHAAFLISRGMRTYFVRHDRQCANAMAVARYLEAHPKAGRVRYPGLESSGDHLLAETQMSDFGTMVSFDFEGSQTQMDCFLDSLQLFPLCASLGSTESLVAPSKSFYGTDLSAEQFRQAGFGDTSIRLSLGIEAEEDLCADLGQAFEKAFQ